MTGIELKEDSILHIYSNKFRTMQIEEEKVCRKISPSAQTLVRDSIETLHSKVMQENTTHGADGSALL